MNVFRHRAFMSLLLLAQCAFVRADLTLSAYAVVSRPTHNEAFTAAIQFGSLWYASVPFRSISSSVRADGGTPNSSACVSWAIMVGYEEGNQGVASAGGATIEFDGVGKFQRTPDISGSADVSVGEKHSSASAEIWVPNTQNWAYNKATDVFFVLMAQQGGGGGGA